MKNLSRLNLLIIALSVFALQAAENDPLTGLPDPNRTCEVRDNSGNCIEWKTKAINPNTNQEVWVIERVCKAPPEGECTAVVVRGNNRAICNAKQGNSCRAVIGLK